SEHVKLCRSDRYFGRSPNPPTEKTAIHEIPRDWPNFPPEFDVIIKASRVLSRVRAGRCCRLGGLHGLRRSKRAELHRAARRPQVCIGWSSGVVGSEATSVVISIDLPDRDGGDLGRNIHARYGATCPVARRPPRSHCTWSGEGREG